MTQVRWRSGSQQPGVGNGENGGMATLVFMHAHPDDEASQTSGTMARAVADGHRVVLVIATNGDHGEVPEDLAPGQTVAEYRRREAEAAARVIGTHRIVWLGYADSGMTGWDQNAHDDAFGRADVAEAAAGLAAVLDEEDADLVTTYDWHGGYGHPDHVQAHRVTHAAVGLARRRPRLLESTMNRDAMRRQYQRLRELGVDAAFDPDAPMDDGNPFGMPEADLHYRVDVSEFIEVKRAALACHASQKTDIGMFLSMPADLFARAFGVEYFIEPGREPGLRDAWILDRQ